MSDCPSFPLRAARHAGRSTIAVKSSLNSIQPDGTQAASQKPRGVENEAMRCIAAQASVTELRALHVRIIQLERIGRQPQNFPHERFRPARELRGMALYRWIGGQLHLKWNEVKLWLEDADTVIAGRIRAGIE